MPKRIASRIALVGLAVAVTPALAQPTTRTAPAAAPAHGRTPAIPSSLRATVSATNGALVIRMNDGSPHRFDISELTIQELEAFQNGRFIGFKLFGNEEYGYVLIDRMGRGETAESHTGGKPSFSSDGRHFAAAEISESGFGNLNGVSLWEVQAAGVKRLFYTDAVRAGFNWRAEPFRQANCVPITSVEQDWQPSTPDRWDAEIANAPRAWYELRWNAAEGLYFGRSSDAACFDDSSG